MSTARIRLDRVADGVHRASWIDPVIGEGDVLVADAGHAELTWCFVADILLIPDHAHAEAVIAAVMSYVDLLRQCRLPDATG